MQVFVSTSVRQPISPQQLLRRLQDLGGGPHCALAFDGDGTLWSGDIGEDVFLAAVKQRMLLHNALPALQAEAQRFGLPELSDANDQALCLFDAYRVAKYPELNVCEMMTWCFAGHTYDNVVEHCRQALEKAGLAARVYRPLQPILEWARATQTLTVVVSASPRFAVIPAAALRGFDRAHIAGGEPTRNDQAVILAGMSDTLPYGRGKSVAADKLLQGRRLLAAFGDNGFDFELLSAAALPVAVRPKPALIARLSELPGVVELQ